MNKIVSKEEWFAAQREHLKKEKRLTHQREEVAAARRALPWVKVEKNYKFRGPGEVETLSELFKDRSQLIVYHFMLAPHQEEGCSGCSFMMDNLPAELSHLNQKDVSFVAVSRAPIERIEAFKRRMGWKNFKWVSSFESDFNEDFEVTHAPEDAKAGKAFYNFGTIQLKEGGEEPGISVFYKDEDGNIYHTYSMFARGLDLLLGTYHYLDLTPKGRDEQGAMNWVKHHDKY